MERMTFDLQEIYNLRRSMKGFLAQLDRALIEFELTRQQINATKSAEKVQTASSVK